MEIVLVLSVTLFLNFISAMSPAPWSFVKIGSSKASQRELLGFIIPLNGMEYTKNVEAREDSMRI